MSFTDDVQKLGQQIKERKQYVRSESTTKSSLISPFIRLLGYDTENPREVVGEYSADFAKRIGGKLECVDYALFKEGNPVIFVEAKAFGEPLGNYEPQLARYFNATPEVRFGILCNGIVYKFFSDLKQLNIMDSEPFFEFKFDGFLDADVQALAKFRKSEFDVKALIEFAEELAHLCKLKSILREMFLNPTDEFIAFLTRKTYNGMVRQRTIDSFRPLVKQSISAIIFELVSQGAIISKPQENTEQEAIKVEEKPIPATDREKLKAETTEDELKAFYIVKELVSEAVKNPEILSYTDAKMYFSIYLESPIWWFVRLYLGAREKHVITKLSLKEIKELAPPKYLIDPITIKGSQKGRIHISKVEDLYDLQDALLRSIKTLHVVENTGLTIADEKMKVFNVIKEMISGFVSEPRLILPDDKKNYFSVYFGTRYKWIARLFIGPRERSIVIRLSVDETNKITTGQMIEGYRLKNKIFARIRIAKLEDIEKIKDLLVQSLKKVAGSSYSKGI